jgi:heme exporter protein A
MTAQAAPHAESSFDSVVVHEVSRHYGRRRALWKVSIACERGSVLGLFGPNGAGKSTLIGVLGTLARPSTGTVTYGARTARQWGDRLRGHIGMLGHDLFLYPELTARENLEFFGRLYGCENLSARVDAALAAARLEARGHDRVSSFSRGLRQRLAVERALLHQPRLVLLDEPFTGLDDASAGLLVGRVRALRETGAIVVLATHDFDLAEGIIDVPVCLSGGRLLPFAPGSDSLRERYRRTLAGAA